MYEEFYGLRKRCFSKTPDPAFLYPSRGHAEALARLQYAVEERELVLLTGDVGCGKTTLSRALIDSLGPEYRPVLIINPRLSAAQFLRALASKIGIDKPRHFKADLIDQVNEALYSMYSQGVCPVVIIDEAQLIPSRDTFEEIRLLTNYQLDDANLLSLVLIGQTELRARLKHPAYAALRQRIGMAFHISPLGMEETEQYLRHRMKVAGGEGDVFMPEAVEALHRHSGGVPRIINTIATAALLSGFGGGRSVIGPEVIEDVVADLDLA